MVANISFTLEDDNFGSSVHVRHTQLWEAASLKCVTGNQLPRPHICVAFIPVEGSRHLFPEQVLTRFRKMNHGLTTLDWTILHKETSGPGQKGTSAMDNSYMAELERRRRFNSAQKLL
ncbi:hypothetical protein JTB14_012712 [Gonioctena quinquepunctata]|nr:hypothetical protein JTB14_012712 [Gonioctena quinquepunctata]